MDHLASDTLIHSVALANNTLQLHADVVRTEDRRVGMRGDDRTVAIIDPDRDVRDSLEALLSSVRIKSHGYNEVNEFVAHEKRAQNCGCLILDVRLPGLGGLDFQAHLLRNGNKTPVVFLTRHADIQMTVRAMKSGAVDFLTKPYREQDLLDAVTVAFQRDQERRERAEALASVYRRRASLSDRERDIMTLVVAGKMNKQIAAELGLSESTVKLHRASVMRKMKARSVPGLVRMADSLAAESFSF